ncbi:hypothetical protein [Pseudonocardia acaciae]|uniref:hypothetical protein n=1 Tax=Pseudonocardia acaciae TaxID=551276 RepID=UPI000490E530|nr:hypothetical protein [Pseudonocardia acaciae]
MTSLAQTGYVLDEPLITGYTRNAPDCHAFVWTAVSRLSMLMAPAIAVTAAWARTSTERERDGLQELLDYPGTRVEPLDEAEAAAVGLTLAEVGLPDLLTAGHVALRAQRWNLPVVTTHPEPLHLINPDLAVIALTT